MILHFIQDETSLGHFLQDHFTCQEEADKRYNAECAADTHKLEVKLQAVENWLAPLEKMNNHLEMMATLLSEFLGKKKCVILTASLCRY